MAKTQNKSKKELAGTHVKLNFRQHFLPPLAGLVIAGLIFGFFGSNLLSGRIAYSLYARRLKSIVPTDPAISQTVPRLLIKRLGVDAPVNFSENSLDQDAFLRDMQSGVVHYPGTALPGSKGNVVIFGHSSEDWWAPGDYKYVFALLNRLTNDDQIIIDYQGARYIYRVYDTKQVEPTKLTMLNQGSSYILTLITSAPAGTDAKRLAIRATQESPAAPADTAYNKPAVQPPAPGGVLPGNSGPFWHDFKARF